MNLRHAVGGKLVEIRRGNYEPPRISNFDYRCRRRIPGILHVDVRRLSSLHGTETRMGKIMRGRRRVLARRARNGEFLDCVSFGNCSGELMLSTRRGYLIVLRVCGFG